MAIKSDFHLHTSYSTDSDESMENVVLKAIELGLKEICLTDHHDIDFPYDENTPEGSFVLNTDAYLYDILKLRQKYQDQINILFGVEVGVQPHLRRELAIYSKSYDFDFIIASTHVVDRKDPYFRDLFSELSDAQLFDLYFHRVYEQLKMYSNFDVLGHLDYIVRYGYKKEEEYSYDKYKDIIDAILTQIIEMEKGIELNTGAIRSGMKELNPCADIVRRYRELGGEIITIGSDAHDVSRIADGFDRAEQVLLDCGFKYYATFEKRVATFHKLG